MSPEKQGGTPKQPTYEQQLGQATSAFSEALGADSYSATALGEAYGAVFAAVSRGQSEGKIDPVQTFESIAGYAEQAAARANVAGDASTAASYTREAKTNRAASEVVRQRPAKEQQTEPTATAGASMDRPKGK